jgi:selenocysteine lyase/cysteine desulfurase
VTSRIYLDNAATSFPKPETVYDAVDRYNRELGAAVGRGAYGAAVEVQRTVDRCRQKAAQLFGVKDPRRIVFTFNGTDSLNLAIHGLLRPGDHVVTTVVEHNSVLRPLRAFQTEGGDRRSEIGQSDSQLSTINSQPSTTHHSLLTTYVDCDDTGRVDPKDIQAAIRPETRLVAVIHASNVTGVLQPIAEIGEIARKAGAVFLVDAAQSAGHVPIDVSSFPVDLLACPGHKGLLGPLGTGILYVREGIEEQLRSTRQGGTGSQSENDSQPSSLPDKYESGNHNAPGLVGLEAGLTYLLDRGVTDVHAHELELTGRLLEGLRGVPGLRIHGPQSFSRDSEVLRRGARLRRPIDAALLSEDCESRLNDGPARSPAPTERVGVVSVSHPDFEPQVLSALLDEHFGIQTRAGLHCAPRIHERLGTLAGGGTVRFSVGPFNTADDIDAAVAALREITGAA